MFNSTVLEVGIGILFCFSAVSLIVSSINEGIASILKLRSKSLLTGVKEMLNDPQVTGLALALYNHGAVNPLAKGDATRIEELDKKPSYIKADTFAKAIIDILQKGPDGAKSLEDAIKAMPDPQLRKLFQGMYQRAGNDLAQFEALLGDWFDSGMDRVAGAYKRKIQLFTVLIGLAIAALFNIDFFHLFSTLWMHPSLAQGLSADTPNLTADVSAQLKALNQLPVGWKPGPLHYSSSDVIIMIGGWMVTALSTLFGAPFWFDLLQKASNLRGAGPNGDEKGKP